MEDILKTPEQDISTLNLAGLFSLSCYKDGIKEGKHTKLGNDHMKNIYTYLYRNT